MRLGSWIAPLGMTLLIASVFARPGVAGNDPAGFVAGIEQRAVQILSNTQLPLAIRRQEFSAVVDRTFDLPAIARFTLGAYWRFATPPQRRQFLGVLGAYLVNVYWSRLQRLQQYHNARLMIVSQRSLGGGTTRVATQLPWPNGQQPVELDWTVVRRGGHYKILDLSIDHFNQTFAERSQFRDLIVRNGGNLTALIAQMQAEDG
jgi:phospholipid transport system substrate-binding protein